MRERERKKKKKKKKEKEKEKKRKREEKNLILEIKAAKMADRNQKTHVTHIQESLTYTWNSVKGSRIQKKKNKKIKKYKNIKNIKKNPETSEDHLWKRNDMNLALHKHKTERDHFQNSPHKSIFLFIASPQLLFPRKLHFWTLLAGGVGWGRGLRVGCWGGGGKGWWCILSTWFHFINCFPNYVGEMR